MKLESQNPAPEDAVITSHLRHALIRNDHFTTDGEATFLSMQQLKCKKSQGIVAEVRLESALSTKSVARSCMLTSRG